MGNQGASPIQFTGKTIAMAIAMNSTPSQLKIMITLQATKR